jgi:hypothetical protein
MTEITLADAARAIRPFLPSLASNGRSTNCSRQPRPVTRSTIS